MNWYYAKKGNIEQRGLVDDFTLREMAKNGQLEPDDLLWDDSDNNTWVRAESIENLFINRKLEIKKPAPALQKPAPTVPANFGKKQKKKRKTHPLKVIIFILGLIVAAILVWKVDEFRKKQEAENEQSAPAETELKDRNN